MNNKQEFKLNWGGKELILETGRLAKQADGAVLISCEGTQVLVTVCSATTARPGQDFFPLTVDYTEKFYAAGKFLGGFLKREGRPSTKETLNSRLIDRPIRPLFPDGYMMDTFVQATVMSYNPKADPKVLGSLGAAAALTISDIPFKGPIGTCKVGRIDGKLVLNPAHDEWENSDLEVVVAASEDAIMMMEGEAQECSEAEMLEVLDFAHEQIKLYCGLVKEMQKACGKEKRVFESAEPNKTLMGKVEKDYTKAARECLAIVPKLERHKAIRALEGVVKTAILDDPKSFGFESEIDDGNAKGEAYTALDSLLYDMLRTDILKEGKRIAGRGLDEVREIETEINILDTPHGSALFTRGETQVLSTITLGGSTGKQMVDTIEGFGYDHFYLHYSFPPFSVGEARGIRGVGRRELGHGNLAQRAIKGVMPSDDKFVYTMRAMCEVLESNGSSSMGSVCAASMAMMDAGVPLKAPVAGVAMGLVKEGDKYQILTDILGDEDHLGDMDFKVAGTEKGICAIQMDIKISGITKEIFVEAMDKAKNGRLHILGEMAKTISEPRSDLKLSVPRIEVIKIPTDKIGALVGPGGKNIRGIQDHFSVELEVTEDGTVKILGNKENIEPAMEVVDLQMNGPKVGADYDGEVVTIKEYGAFVDIAPGVSGLLHISELANTRVNDVEEYLSEGDKITVRILDVDRFGKMKLSVKAIKPLEKKKK